jgi:DNA anti-recombination protein RmuC
MASAKFIISLTGLFCSILLNIWLSFLSRRIENRADELTDELENSMNFISLEGLAEKQLRATEDQAENLKAVVTQLVAELDKSIQTSAAQTRDSLEEMARSVGTSISSGIGDSLERAAERIETASKSLGSLGDSLGSAAQQFDGALARSTDQLREILAGLEDISGRLASAGDSLAQASPLVIETIRESNAKSLQVAEGAAEMIGAAKIAISEEKTVVLEAMRSVEALIRTFEQRAAAYDGQLEKAFAVYQKEVAETIARLETHGIEVQKRFAHGLEMLTAVIQNAKAFEPESRPAPDPDPAPDDEPEEPPG